MDDENSNGLGHHKCIHIIHLRATIRTKHVHETYIQQQKEKMSIKIQ